MLNLVFAATCYVQFRVLTSLFCVFGSLFLFSGALCDMKADASVGKRTIATLLGKATTLHLLMAVWFTEGGVLGLVFREYWGAALYGVLGVAMVMGRLRIGHMYQLTGAVCMVLLLKRWYVDGSGGGYILLEGLGSFASGGDLA